MGPVKDGKVWRHRVMLGGVRSSGTFGTKAAALAWEAERRTSTKQGIGSGKTCEDAFNRYEREVSPTKRGQRWEALRLRRFAVDLGRIPLSKLTTADIGAWRDNRLLTVSGSTVNREMNLLSNVFSVARKEWGWITDSPTKDVRRPKESLPRNRRISDAEIEAIRLVLGWPDDNAPTLVSHRVAIAFLFAIETAMRAGEICKLTQGDVQGRVACLTMTKNGYDRSVPLSPRALALWAFVPNGFGLKPDSLSTWFLKTRNRAGIPDLTFHDTRHEAITRLAKKLHVLDLARMTGHRDIKQLMIYYNESPDEIADKLA